MTENDYPLRPQGRLPESSGTHRPREFFETIAGPDATPYPAEVDEPNVYYARRLKNVRFTETVGQQTLTYDTTEDKRFIFNMEAEKYIEEGSIISCWRQNGQWWTIDKVRQEELLILCHARGATSHSTGSVSRLDPNDGTVVWTYDLGIDPDTSKPKVAYSADIDSRGRIYVAWQVATSDSGSAGIGASGPSGGIVKLSRDGALLASHTFPSRHGSFSTGTASFDLNAKVRVDPANNDRIYYAGDYDQDGYWLYRLDSNLVPVWGVGPAETEVGNTGRIRGLAIGPNGNPFVSNIAFKVYKLDSGGSLVTTVQPFNLSGPTALVVDGSDQLRAGSERQNPADPLVAGMNAALTMTQFLKAMDDFSMAPPAGDWLSFIGTSYRVSTIADQGGSLLFGLGLPGQWDLTTPPPEVLYASILRVSSVGNIIDARGWGNWTNGTPSYVLGAAHNAVTNRTYVAGAAVKAGGGNLMAGMLGDWESQVLTTNPGLFAWGIAVRTVS